MEDVDPKGQRAEHGIAAIGYEIYVIGGSDGKNFLHSCRCFNTNTKEWKKMASMKNRR
jgi:hypothetical protein